MKTQFFTVPGDPKGKARPQVFRNKYTGQSHGVTPKSTVMYENLVRTCFQSKYPHHVPSDGPVFATITAYYSIPKSTSKKKRQFMLSGDICPMKKPDVDNIVKSILDSLNEIAFTDDSHVVQCTVEKHYGEQPRVDVELKFPEEEEN